ncbi:MAG: ABC transporter permease [Gammaproteobacteria bacterium]|nr:ABC transporter permease [Gammaproteobacteria bacterium]
MTLAMFKAMFLKLMHDRGSLAMAFLLPVIFFLVLAEIFSVATGTGMQLRVGIADEVNNSLSQRLVHSLDSGGALERVGGEGLTAEDVTLLVRKGTADVGLIVRADARALDDMSGFGEAPLLIVSDPVRGVAAPMLAGQLQRTYFEALPEVAVGSVAELIADQYVELDEVQQDDLQSGLDELRDDAVAGRPGGFTFDEIIEQQAVVGQSEAMNHVAYYAGAVAFLFLLFASMQGAMSLAEEQESGILDRIMAGPGGIMVLINGKFLFLVVQGFAQMLLIFLVAWQVYGVDLPAHAGSWALITLAACLSAAGFGLLVTAACSTRMQAQNLSTVLILILSVVGGSMVPRFFMPEWLRELGWLTPNTWVLEAYSAIFWRNEGIAEVLLACALLAVTGLIGLFAAQWMAARRAHI